MDVFLSIPMMVAYIVFLVLTVIALRHRQTFDDDVIWFDHFSVEPYVTMIELLRQNDIDFIKQSNPQLARSLRRARARLFDTYLNQLQKDCERVYAMGATLATETPALSFLAPSLRTQRVSLTVSILALKSASLLFRLGLRPLPIAPTINAASEFTNSIRHLKQPETA